MKDAFPHLLSPGKLGSVRIPNRIVFLPHYPALDSEFSQTYLNYYRERAQGGTGLIVVGSHAVSFEGKMGWGYINGGDERILPFYKKLAEECHEYGSKVFVQLTHGGHTSMYHPPQLLLAPSQMVEPYAHYNTKEMEIEDIRKVIADFTFAARLVQDGGCDGLEIKGASHDGLLRSFISPYFNRRTDEYGGSFENRMRLSLEVVHAIREAVGPGYPIGMRICMDEFTSWGYGTEEGKKILKTFESTGEIDYFSCDAGCYSAFYMEIPPMAIPLGFAEYLSAEMRQITDLPVVAFGRINDPVQAERILADGNADFIGMARELVCEPQFANKIKEGREDEIRHCIACMDGCVYQVMQDRPLRCIQNPAAGREAELGAGTLRPAARRKTVAVIGGGPAGLKAAEISARRGHTVTLYEEKEELGGQVNIAAMLPMREEVKDVVRWLGLQVAKLGVEIYLGERMTAEKVKGLHSDVVVVATGSRPAAGEGIPVEGGKILNVWDVLVGKADVGEHVVLFDTTRRWPGLGTAEFLVNQGKRVDIVTPYFNIGEQIEPGSVTLALQRIMDKEARLLTSSTVKRVEGSAVVVASTLTHREQRIEGVDSVVLSVGNRSDRDLYDELKGHLSGELYFVGDAVAPRLIQQVIYEAELLARAL